MGSRCLLGEALPVSGPPTILALLEYLDPLFSTVSDSWMTRGPRYGARWVRSVSE